MKAARFYGAGDIRVEEIPESTPSKGQVKVKIAWNGICGSDLHAYLGPVPKYASSVPDEVTGESAPVTLGHEFAGTIVELGPEVDNSKWSVGQNVVIEPVISCMKTSTCKLCASGSRNLCPVSNFIGISGWGGGLSEYIAVGVQYLHILPDNIPLEIGACMEPLAVAWYAIKRSGFTKGNSVLVLGAGPIGVFLVKILRSFDPSATIITSEPALLRRQQALKHGASHAFDPLHVDVPAAVMKATGDTGVDIAFDAAGVQPSIDAAIQSVRPRGTIVNVAIWEKPAALNMNAIVMKEIVLTGTAAYDRVHPELIEAIAAGKIPGLEELITRKIALEDVVEKGFRALLDDKDAQVKILVHP
ncbi:alcohol dehydrogenase GroES domain protein [Lyophyllum atratum]|nr:alcohol dehydrogenase GroES domain protein [Lyophyllum atratum]